MVWRLATAGYDTAMLTALLILTLMATTVLGAELVRSQCRRMLTSAPRRRRVRPRTETL